MFDHIGGSEIVLIFLGLAYTVSLVRDWKPIRSLRDENRELRAAFEKLQKRYDDLEQKYNELTKSRDFQAAFEPLARAIETARSEGSREHAEMLKSLEAHELREEQAWAEITRGLAANTSALGALAAGINAGTVTSS